MLAAALLRPADAAQYKSETRELQAVPQNQQAATAKGLEQQLAGATDPYTRAMILRELAYDAANRGDGVKAQRYVDDALKTGGLSAVAAAQLRKELPKVVPVAPKPVAPAAPAAKPKTVLEQLEGEIRAGRASPEVQVAVAGEYLQRRRVAEAIPLLEQGIARSRRPDPSWKQALLRAYLAEGREAQAIPLLQEQLGAAPQVRENWLRLVAYALKGGDTARAAALMELAARQGHLKSADERLQLAGLLERIGAPFEAGSALQRWLEQGQVPRTAANWNALAALWVRAREPGLAVTALEEVGRVGGGGPKLLAQIGQLQMDRRLYAAAAGAFDGAVAGGGKSGPLLLSLGLAHYQQADLGNARRAFAEAEQFPASRPLARRWLKYLESGEAARAQAEAQLAAATRFGAAEDARTSGRLGGGTVAAQGRAGATANELRVASAESLAAALAPKEAALAPIPDARLAAAEAPAGDRLTPIGAERAGTKDGRIPAWTGGLATTPAGWVRGQRLADPYAADRPLFTIGKANLAQYKGSLSPGHLALFAKYPDYRMPVYATRRSAAYPEAIYAATKANVSKARLEGSDALVGAKLGFPFPEPRNGVEAMWNHRTRYRGDSVSATYTQAVMREGEAPRLAKQSFRLYFRYSNIADPVDIAKQNRLVYGITWVAEKGTSPSFVALFHETANSLRDPRNVWILIVKIGRMLRIPPVGYDQPFPASDGLEFIDMVDMYNGAFDRYVWKLEGKRALYIPYNAYRLSDGSTKYAELLGPHFPKPEATRYELHRVWVIEATERGGARHVFGKRRFYLDEDSWNLVMVENEDREGRLWRFQEGHLAQLYDVKAMTAVPTFTYDLKDGRYFANRLFAEDLPFRYDEPMSDNQFLPAAVKTKYSH